MHETVIPVTNVQDQIHANSNFETIINSLHHCSKLCCALMQVLIARWEVYAQIMHIVYFLDMQSTNLIPNAHPGMSLHCSSTPYL